MSCLTRKKKRGISTHTSENRQQMSAAAPNRKAPALLTDSAVNSISAPKNSV